MTVTRLLRGDSKQLSTSISRDLGATSVRLWRCRTRPWDITRKNRRCRRPRGGSRILPEDSPVPSEAGLEDHPTLLPNYPHQVIGAAPPAFYAHCVRIRAACNATS